MKHRALIYTVSIIIAFIYIFIYSAYQPILTSDSPGYIEFAPYRTAGYPIYINIIGLEWAVKIQPVLYVLAVAFLWRELEENYNIYVSATVALLCIINPEVNRFHYYVMTESLFMTTSILSLAFMLMHLRLRSISSAALASLFVGASACVRPSAYALIPALLVMVIFTWSAIQTRKVIIVIVAILPAIFICAVERLGTRSYHGSAARSLAGLIFFAKSGMIDAPPSISSSYPGKFALESALQSTFAPIRQLLLEVPRWDVREVISEAYEECLEYTCTKKLKESLNLSAPMVDKLII